MAIWWLSWSIAYSSFWTLGQTPNWLLGWKIPQSIAASRQIVSHLPGKSQCGDHLHRLRSGWEEGHVSWDTARRHHLPFLFLCQQPCPAPRLCKHAGPGIRRRCAAGKKVLCSYVSLENSPCTKISVALKEPFIPLSPPHPLLKVSFRRPCKVFTIQKGNCLGKLESFIVLCDNHEAVREQSQCLTKQ